MVFLHPETIIKKSKSILVRRSQQRLSNSEIQLMTNTISTKNSKILFLLNNSTYAAHYSFKTSNKSILTPYNLNGENLHEFLRYIQPTHIIRGYKDSHNKHSAVIEQIEHDNIVRSPQVPIGDLYLLGTINAKNL